MRKATILISCMSLLVLSACAGSDYADLKGWMADQKKQARGAIKPLPAAKTFVPVDFSSKGDPFKDKPTISVNLEKNKYAPDPNRRKEPLENYQLSQLKMVGILSKDKNNYAMIKTPDGTISYVGVGNYMGNNYGKIVSLDDENITLDERTRNSSDEWQPKKTVINLEDGEKK